MTVIIDSTAVINAVRLAEQAGDPAAPAASFWLLYTKAGGLYIEDSSSVVTGPFGTGGGGTWGCVTLLNDTGGTVNAGDVVAIVDYATASAFTSFAGVANEADFIMGVVEDASIANGASGLVRFFGIAPVINLDASASIADRIGVSQSVAKQGAPYTHPDDFNAGDFGIALDTGTTPPAFLWGGPPVQRMERTLRRHNAQNVNSGTPPIIYTVPTGCQCIITRIVLWNASTSLTTWSGSFGWNSAAYDDVIANATHTELVDNTVYTVLPAKTGAKVGTSGQQLKMKNNTLQGSSASVGLEIIGYLIGP